jgi:hypothetical protein
VKERRAAVNRAEANQRVVVAQNSAPMQKENAATARQVQQQKVAAERAEAKHARAREDRPHVEEHKRGKNVEKPSADR